MTITIMLIISVARPAGAQAPHRGARRAPPAEAAGLRVYDIIVLYIMAYYSILYYRILY